MVKIFDVNQDKLVQELASDFTKEDKLKMPEWALFVKTGANKERPPSDKIWWQMRTASILKKIYTHGPIGVSKLRTKYGSKKNRGVRPEKFMKSSGKIIRTILQQLEVAGYIKKEEKANFKGRIISPKGISLLDKTAGKIYKKKVKKVKQEPKKEKKIEPASEPKEKAKESPQNES